MIMIAAGRLRAFCGCYRLCKAVFVHNMTTCVGSSRTAPLILYLSASYPSSLFSDRNRTVLLPDHNQRGLGYNRNPIHWIT
jgi:hypothetical protein